VSSTLADTFRTQGVGSVTMIDGTRAVVALLAAGSTAPDVVEVALDSPASIAAAVNRLDHSIALSGTWMDLELIDVADVPGPVIVAPGGAGSFAPGDILLQADGQRVADAAAVAASVAARQPGDVITLEAKNTTGVARRAEMKIVAAPKLIG